jgi:two-component system, LuxR family, sensor kinase FixL
VVLVGFGIAAARFTGERLARPFRALAALALAHGRGERVEICPLGLKEADDLASAFAEGSRLLAERTAERDRAERERQQAEARQQALQSEMIHVARLSEMGQMSAALGHELNQPLAAASTYLEASLRMLPASPAGAEVKLADTLRKAGEQVQRAGEIMRRIRDFAKKGEVSRRVEDLAKVIEEANAVAMAGSRSLGIRLRLDLDPRARIAVIDRVQIQQVIVNLVRNAIEAMAGSERRELAVSTVAREDGFQEVRIVDTGPGLPAEVSAQLFEPFVTTKKNGIGIGLSICRSIVEAHGGEIWVAANPGGGTRFCFTVPATADAKR